jgi:hypothetical protein
MDSKKYSGEGRLVTLQKEQCILNLHNKSEEKQK